MPTRWNSTLAMLQRLHRQKRAINQYLCDYGTRTGSGDLGFFAPRHWLSIQDACTVLLPFEEATKMVSRDSACISDTIPLVFLLEHTLKGIMEKVLEAEQGEEEEAFPTSQGPPHTDTILERSHNEEEEEEEEEDDDSPWGGAETDGGTNVHGLQSTQTSGVQRGWDDTVVDNVHLSDPEEDDAPYPCRNLQRMGHLILQSLKKDPRIVNIKEKDHYWLAALLDPRYKAKVSELIVPSLRDQKMRQLRDALKRKLCHLFPECGRSPSTGVSGDAAGQRRSAGGMGGGGGGGGGVRLCETFENFFSSSRQGLSALGSHPQRLHNMVDDYLEARSDTESFTLEDPVAYWVRRMDHWPELAQYAIELLGCPAASVLSERTFSAAGGFVTDKRVRLATGSVDRLTFIKMNQSWISSSYQAPDTDLAQ